MRSINRFAFNQTLKWRNLFAQRWAIGIFGAIKVGTSEIEIRVSCGTCTTGFQVHIGYAYFLSCRPNKARNQSGSGEMPGVSHVFYCKCQVSFAGCHGKDIFTHGYDKALDFRICRIAIFRCTKAVFIVESAQSRSGCGFTRYFLKSEYIRICRAQSLFECKALRIPVVGCRRKNCARN